MLRRGIEWRRIELLGCLFCLLDVPSRGAHSSAATGGILGLALYRAFWDRKIYVASCTVQTSSYVWFIPFAAILQMYICPKVAIVDNTNTLVP